MGLHLRPEIEEEIKHEQSMRLLGALAISARHGVDLSDTLGGDIAVLVSFAHSELTAMCVALREVAENRHFSGSGYQREVASLLVRLRAAARGPVGSQCVLRLLAE